MAHNTGIAESQVRSLVVAIGIILLPASGAIIASAKRPRCAALLFAASLGLILGFTTGRRVERDARRSGTGVMLDNVREFTGTAAGDSVTLRDGRTVFSVALRRVFTQDGTSATAGGNAVVFVSPATGALKRVGTLPHWGQEVDVTARLLPAKGNDGPRFICFTSARHVRTSGYRIRIMKARVAVYDRLSTLIQKTGGKGAGLFRALFLGDQSDLTQAEIASFQRAGCAHILALSGMHLGILTLLVSALLSLVIGRRRAFAVGAVFVVVYIFVVGMRASLVRAGMMYLLFGYASTRGRPVKPINVLALSFTLQTVLAPETVFTLSFQLSYLALAGILTVGRRLHQVLSPLLTPLFSMPIAASMGAQLLTLPLLIIHFGVFYPIGTIAGVVISPVVTAFMWIGIAGLFVGSAPAGLVLAGAPQTSQLLAMVGNAIQALAGAFARVPGVHFSPLVAATVTATILAGLGAMYAIRRTGPLT